jgi:hypothetical protein
VNVVGKDLLQVISRDQLDANFVDQDGNKMKNVKLNAKNVNRVKHV